MARTGNAIAAEVRERGGIENPRWVCPSEACGQLVWRDQEIRYGKAPAGRDDPELD